IHDAPPDSRYLHSFPTRRSSDLQACAERLKSVMENHLVKKLTLVAMLLDHQSRYLSLRLFLHIFAAVIPEQKGDAHFPILLIVRSEEHTSELQSRFDLVCRLLLE